MRTRCRIVLALALVWLVFNSQAQSLPTGSEYLVQNWQTDDGLAQNWVSSIAQTPDGYLWVGTRYGGLARFDGVRFVFFTPQNTPELRDTQVERLSLDSDGTLWIAMGNRSVSAMRQGRFELLRLPRTEPQARLETILATGRENTLFTAEAGEVAELDRSKGTNGWRIYQPAPAPKASQYNVYPAETFHQDRDGNLWYIDRNKHLARFAVEGDQKNPADLHFPQPSQANALAVDAQGVLWIATSSQILSWNGQAVEDHTPPDTDGLSEVRQIAFSGDGSLWVFEPQRLRKLSDGKWTTATGADLESIASENYQLYGDSSGGAWIASYGRGLLHARADGTMHWFTEKDGLPSGLITSWFEDKEGNVWIGTVNGGLARIRARVFRTLEPSEGLSGKMVRTVGVDPTGSVWCGTASGQLIKWSNGNYTVIPLTPVEASPISGVTVWPSRTGAVWVGSREHGFLRIEDGQITSPIPSARPWLIRVFFEDSHGALWIGARGALRKYASGNLTIYGSSDGFESGVAIGAITEDAAGALWIGTELSELWRFKDNKFTCFHIPSEWPSSQVFSLQADTNGVIWVGTLGNGLLQFKNGRFTRFMTSEGLPNNNVTQILDDGNGYLWGGTYAGIFRVRKSDLNELAADKTTKLVCSSYGKQDGLPALECSGGFNPACWHADDGRLWFSTVNGLVSVNPSAVPFNRRPPDVIIEELRIDGELRTLPTAGQPGLAGLEIDPGRHFLQFRFTGLSFGAPEKVRFRWKLDGIDRDDWHDCGTERVIGCGPLSPGSYQLQVRACNADGVWNDAGATLAFKVLPQFWETWWFKASAVAGSLAGILTIFFLSLRRRYRQSMERMKRQHEVETERARIARDLHDDLGTSLTQIIMLSSLANREHTRPEKARQLIDQVGGRSKEMVTALDEIVWAVNPKNDSLVELVRYLGHFTEELVLPADIRCRLNIPLILPSHPLSAEIRHHLFLAFKEALNNCVRHSGAGQIRLGVELKPGEVIIRIEDDGKGFGIENETAGRQGNGLANIRKRMEQIGGSAEIQSTVGRGTTMIFHLPLTAPVVR